MRLKFLTINILFGGMIWDNLVRFIRDEKPDILAIQEVYNGQNPSLEKRYRTMNEFEALFSDSLPYNAFGATVLDKSVQATWGNAVFSRFPIANYKTVFFNLPFTEYDFDLDTDPRLAAEGMLEVEIIVDDKKLHVYSWHGVWDNHGGDTDSRFIMGEKIIEAIKGKENVILAGDTNVNPDTQVISNISEKLGLVSVFGNSLQSTFNMKHKKEPGNYAHSPVDQVFVSPNFQIIEKEMPQVDVSDHYPLKVLLEV